MSGDRTNHWYPWLDKELTKIGCKVDRPTFPNNLIAREEILLEFASKFIDKNTIIIGHSSGSSVALRIAEKNRIYGSILVGGLYKDLGYEDEIKTGIFAHPWDWEKIKENQNWIIQLDSNNDPFIPQEHFEELAENTNSEHIKLPNRRHFGDEEDIPLEFPELLDAIEKKL
jgi:predicted alpha/beta hydrolase family esterase